jgi:hypothetical protein
MILARLARARPISWLVALLWVLGVSAAITGSRTTRNGRILEARQADALPAARSTTGDGARIVGADRSVDGLSLAPPEPIAFLANAKRFRPRSRTTTELTGASRPRRLAFRYDATAPPLLNRIKPSTRGTLATSGCGLG